MRPAPDLHVEWVENEAVILDPKTTEVHYLNTSAALTYAYVLEFGVEGALEKLRTEHADAPEEEIRALVADLVERGILIDG